MMMLDALEAWEHHGGEPDRRAAAALDLLAAAVEAGSGVPAPVWHRFLDTTRRPAFLRSLPTRDDRYRWAEAACAGIRASHYTLATMLDQRVREHPGRALFQESPAPGAALWSYEAVSARLARTAAVLLRSRRGRPRVAIVSANRLDGACADLACLVHGIPVAPLNPEMDEDALGWILGRLQANVVVAETDDLRARAERAPGAPPHVAFVLDSSSPVRGAAEARLAEAVAGVGSAQVSRALEGRAAPPLDEPATVMFTSGSTGLPKGVVHTGLALVTKRFARAAALPAVGDGERLLSYLPLFHTFGRYLEMLGMLFWGGTYVFAGNPSFDTLARAMPEVRPTGLVGVPRRWEQLRERCLARGDGEEALREVVGDRLRWGLSAAGCLDPAAFRYFQRRGVELCSGFGMTEATGGITMTPPGEYEEGSVGVLLPGIEGRLSPIGELEVAGPYVARYLDDAAPLPGEKRWLATGDVFVRRPSGHFEIVDRVKDIYKNTRGQTVAPAAVERRLADVPGLKRAFLVGDGRDHNVLLIVPDRSEPALAAAPPEAAESYFSQLVAAVNRAVAAPERVVRFALVERDFDPERELTPKGSYRRKEIARNFGAVIEELYRSDAVEIECGRVRARVPRWFFRDLALLEADIVAREGALLDLRAGRSLALLPGPEPGSVRVGDLEYRALGEVVDLGLFARQPLLWAGNPSLRAFAPCRDGWDVPLGSVSPQVRLPAERGPAPVGAAPAIPLRDPALEEVHETSVRALFAEGPRALEAVEHLAGLLPRTERRLAWLVRRRLETLAWHPDLEARCLAYRTLLLDERVAGYGALLASFVESGNAFLNEASIEAIARARPDLQRLEVLRRQLLAYRQGLDWPASCGVRESFRNALSLLARSARLNPAHVVPIRAELAAWALFDREPELAAAARAEIEGLIAWSRGRHRHHAPSAPSLQGAVPEEDVERLSAVIGDQSFLTESVALAFDEEGASPPGPGGIWLSPLPSTHRHRLFRASFEGQDGRHRDLLLSLRGDVGEPRVGETVLWMTALGDPPSGSGLVPRFGCAREDLGVLSTAFVSGLTAWDRLRGLAEAHDPEDSLAPESLRFLLVRALAAFFAGWRASEERILPGPVLPTNVVVPEPDYRCDVRILSLAGWRRYEGPGSLVEQMRRHFFEQTSGHYPALGERLDPLWIGEAAAEALGPEGACRFLDELLAEGRGPLDAERLRVFRDALRRAYRPTLALEAAIGRYARWREANPRAPAVARRQLVVRLLRLYALEPLGDLARYTLYRRTYFEDGSEAARGALDALVQRLFERPGEAPTRLVELAALQAALTGADDRRAFGELVFPRVERLQEAEIEADPAKSRAVVVSHVTDVNGRGYSVREPLGPSEIGRLYRLLTDAGLHPPGAPRHLILLDGEERVAGGISWSPEDPQVARVEAIVVAPSVLALGLAAPLVEDLCARLASAGYAAVHTDLGSGPFSATAGFRADRRRGGLVRRLDGDGKP